MFFPDPRLLVPKSTAYLKFKVETNKVSTIVNNIIQQSSGILNNNLTYKLL